MKHCLNSLTEIISAILSGLECVSSGNRSSTATFCWQMILLPFLHLKIMCSPFHLNSKEGASHACMQICIQAQVSQDTKLTVSFFFGGNKREEKEERGNSDSGGNSKGKEKSERREKRLTGGSNRETERERAKWRKIGLAYDSEINLFFLSRQQQKREREKRTA